MADANRRGFIGSLFAVAAGAAAASLLGGCAEPVGEEEAAGGPEIVRLRPGMRHFNTAPSRLASVRTSDVAYVPEEALTTKAMG